MIENPDRLQRFDDTGKDDEWGTCMNAVLGKENDTRFLYSLV